MQKIIFTFLLFLFVAPMYAQVGINTNDPTSDLDINGSMRLRGGGLERSNFKPEKILAVDESGFIQEVDLDENLYFNGTTLKVAQRKVEIGAVPDFNATGRVNNAALLIWPGGINRYRSVVRLQNSQGDLEFSGIDGGEDGMVIKLYPVDGTLQLNHEDNNSDPENRIRIPGAGGEMNVDQYGMIQLLYDGTIQRWIVMHFDRVDNED